MNDTIIESNNEFEDRLKKYSTKRKGSPKPIDMPVNLTRFEVVGQEGSMLVVKCVIHFGGLAGHDVTFMGPLQAIQSTEEREPQGPILVNLLD